MAGPWLSLGILPNVPRYHPQHETITDIVRELFATMWALPALARVYGPPDVSREHG